MRASGAARTWMRSGWIGGWEPAVRKSGRMASSVVLDDTLAQDLAPVRVNTVIPGAADTPLWDMLPADKKAERMEQIGRGLPVGRVGQADDVARQIIACMVNPFMTGSLVVLDGGGSI